MTREQLAEDIRYNEMQAAHYRRTKETTPVASRMIDILLEFYEAEVARLKSRLAEWQKEARREVGISKQSQQS